MTASRCYPGTVLESDHGRAVAGVLVGSQGALHMVTVGHFCTKNVDSSVVFDAGGQKIELGRINQNLFLYDDTYDVGAIRTKADRVGHVTLGLLHLGRPYRFSKLQEIDDLPCYFYLGGLGWRKGIIESVQFSMTADHHLILVKDTTNDDRGADFGHSGSPLYIRGKDGHELVGLYLGSSESGLLRFRHPGPGLNRLGLGLS